ncbi:MAG: hypothetical protein ACJ735_10695 [Actinomycetes bacterium]
MRRHWGWVLVPLFGVAVAVPAHAQSVTPVPMAGHAASGFNGCAFTSNYWETGTRFGAGTLSFSGGVQCPTANQIYTDVMVVDGVAAPMQLGTGAPVGLVDPGSSGPTVGKVVWHRTAFVESSTQNVLYGSHARPPAGHVYTILTTAYFSDPCGSGPCGPGGKPPGLLKSLTATNDHECQAERVQQWDAGCSYQFTVVGTTLPKT